MIEYSLLSQKLLVYEIQASKVGFQIDPKMEAWSYLGQLWVFIDM